jgi:hypothetical protein
MSYLNSFLETKIHAPSRIRTRGPNIQAATELRVKQHGHRIGSKNLYSELNIKFTTANKTTKIQLTPNYIATILF